MLTVSVMYLGRVGDVGIPVYYSNAVVWVVEPFTLRFGLHSQALLSECAFLVCLASLRTQISVRK